jgi:hypothetical protein
VFVSKPVQEVDILSFYVAEFVQALSQCSQKALAILTMAAPSGPALAGWCSAKAAAARCSDTKYLGIRNLSTDI